MPAYNRPCGPIAQLVEQGTFNPKVAGSSPARPTVKSPAQGRFVWFQLLSSIAFSGHIWSHELPGGAAKRGAESVCRALICAGERVAVDAKDEGRIGVPEPVGDHAWREPSVQ